MMKNPFTTPPETEFNFLSLGAGVQSSCLALMAAHGHVKPMPTAAIFADTQAEPKNVYEWLDWIEKKLPFPVHRVSAGSLTRQITTIQHASTKNGMLLRKSIPFFVDVKRSSEGKLFRDCTKDFKITPLIAKQRELAGIARGQKEITVTTWIGISWDEMQRCKESREKWCQHRFPLLEMEMRRSDCIKWMSDHGYPSPPRSACVYCPYHSNDEWARLKRDYPDEFAEAVRVEREVQRIHSENGDLPGAINGVPYLHRSLKKIDEVDFSSDVDKGQLLLWNEECDGMCGV